jgi:ankyrin repeat protein
MDLLKILGICVLVAGLSGCRKKSDSRAAEVREAGYEMTAEGWFDAIRDNDVAVMRKMVDGGFDDKTLDSEGNSGLHLAAGSGSQAVGEYLLNRGHSVDVVGANGRTPLMSAVLADRPAMVKWLLRQGADPKLKDGSGFMALMLAASDGKMASVEELAPYQRR